jgi:hypothetical protein
MTMSSSIYSSPRWLSAIAAAVVVGSSLGAQEVSCKVTGRTVALPGLSEASGVAASRRNPGVLWSHNDSGEPVVFALTTEGVKGSIRVTGTSVSDWESVSVGSCPGGTCVYLGDIGDNGGKRRDITIYRVPEPAVGAKETENAESMRLTYPDEPQDAEGLFVMPNERVFIVTKGESGPVAVYRASTAFKNGASVQMERVATLVEAGEGKESKKKGKNGGVANKSKVTGAAASPDGKWVAIRTHDAVTFHAANELTAGKVRKALEFDVSSLGEQQGEGIEIGPQGAVWLTSEGGGRKRPGTLARLQCVLP